MWEKYADFDADDMFDELEEPTFQVKQIRISRIINIDVG